MIKCHFCGEPFFVHHHISYKTGETIPLCKSCHMKVTVQMSGSKDCKGRYLCIKCGRHYTSNYSKICYYCENPDEYDWFGLCSKDKRKPIYRYDYSFLGIGELEWI